MATEKRLIDADALLEKTNELELATAKEWSWQGMCDGIFQVKELIEAAPAVDAVKVVRCKDCKHREDGLCSMESIGGYPWNATKDDDFCSYGERRTE